MTHPPQYELALDSRRVVILQFTPDGDDSLRRWQVLIDLRHATTAGEVAEELRKTAHAITPIPSGYSIADDELIRMLPNDNSYMDPPDGGSVSLFEQLQRMAADATAMRNLRQTGQLPTGINTPPPVAKVIPLAVLEDDIGIRVSSNHEDDVRALIKSNAADAKKWRERKVPDTAHNLLTHRESWINALRHFAEDQLPGSDRSFWEREAKTLRETLDDLTTYFGMTVPRKAIDCELVALAKRVQRLGLLSKEVSDEEVERIVNAVAES